MITSGVSGWQVTLINRIMQIFFRLIWMANANHNNQPFGALSAIPIKPHRHAQDEGPSPYVFRITAGACESDKILKKDPEAQRLLTGFMVQGRSGIVTALHGVVGCDNISANSEITDNYFSKLEIIGVDLDRDMALLGSDELDKRKDGLVAVSPGYEIRSGARNLAVIGHPYGSKVQQEDIGEFGVRRPPLGTLQIYLAFRCGSANLKCGRGLVTKSRALMLTRPL